MIYYVGGKYKEAKCMDKSKLGDILANAGNVAKEHINKSKDAAIRSMVQNESRRYLEYEIEF